MGTDKHYNVSTIRFYCCPIGYCALCAYLCAYMYVSIMYRFEDSKTPFMPYPLSMSSSCNPLSRQTHPTPCKRHEHVTVFATAENALMAMHVNFLTLVSPKHKSKHRWRARPLATAPPPPAPAPPRKRTTPTEHQKSNNRSCSLQVYPGTALHGGGRTE